MKKHFNNTAKLVNKPLLWVRNRSQIKICRVLYCSPKQKGRITEESDIAEGALKSVSEEPMSSGSPCGPVFDPRLGQLIFLTATEEAYEESR